MINRIVRSLFLVALFALVVLSLNCSTAREDVRGETYTVLQQMNKAGIASFDAEIAKIDQQLRDNQDNFTKLDQVVASALKWVEDKKATVDINAIPCG